MGIGRGPHMKLEADTLYLVRQMTTTWMRSLFRSAAIIAAFESPVWGRWLGVVAKGKER